MTLAPLAPWSHSFPVAPLPAVLIEVPRIGPSPPSGLRPRRLLKPKRRLKPLFRRLAWCILAAASCAAFVTFSPRSLLDSHANIPQPLSAPPKDHTPLTIPNAVVLSLEPSQSPSARPSGFLIPDDPQEETADARP
jgi:hypothetical protein